MRHCNSYSLITIIRIITIVAIHTTLMISTTLTATKTNTMFAITFQEEEDVPAPASQDG